MFFLKTFREPAFLTVLGRVFHSLVAEQENDPSYIVVRDFGTYNDTLLVDRKFRICTCDTGFSKVNSIRIQGLGHSRLYMMRNARFGPLTLLMTLRVIDVKSDDKFTRLFYGQSMTLTSNSTFYHTLQLRL